MRITNYQNSDAAKEAGWIPAKNILSFINHEIGFSINQNEDYGYYAHDRIGVSKIDTSGSGWRGYTFNLVLRVIKKDKDFPIVIESENVLMISSETISLKEDLNKIGCPGCFMVMFHEDDIKKILNHPVVLEEIMRMRFKRKSEIKKEITNTKNVKSNVVRCWMVYEYGLPSCAPENIFRLKKLSGKSWSVFKKSLMKDVI